MSSRNKRIGSVIGLLALLFIVSIFISLFSGEFNLTEVKKGRTITHIGILLFTWGILIPISFKYADYSFVFKWISTLERILQFGKTNTAYTSFNTLIIISFGVIGILIGLGFV